ncbi:MAG: hypothetical protein CMJ78_02810 [Planctomycetaceae bacterium]|nr:hypothetical protein [Planctomycetaceae bacterium]
MTTLDRFEPNDDVPQATDLGQLEGLNEITDLTIHVDGSGVSNRDLYQFEIAAAGQENHFVQIAFDDDLGDLDMRLFTSNGGFVGSSAGVQDTERISLEGLDPGFFLIEVFGFAGDSNEYNLTINAPTATLGADRFEDNDDLANATQLGVVGGNIEIDHVSIEAPGDGDFYQFTIAQDARPADFVEILFEHSVGDLDMTLLSLNGEFIAGAGSTTDNERLELFQGAALPAGSYVLNVFGFAGATAPYSIRGHAPSILGPDRFEPNSTINQATPIGTISGDFLFEDLTIHADEAGNPLDDFYSFTTTADGRSGDFVDVLFSHAEGNLDVQLLAENGTLISESMSSTDNETLEFFERDALPAGNYFLRVFGVGGSTAAYTIIGHAPGVLRPDGFEPNDTAGEAIDFGTIAGELTVPGLTIHANVDGSSNDDFYRFTLAEEAMDGHFVGINFDDDIGDLDLTLTGPTNFGRFSASVTDNELISLANAPSGEYLVRVNGFNNSTAPYDLVFNTPGGAFAPDALEANDTLGAATDLRVVDGTVTIENLTIHDNGDGTSNDDFFRFELDSTARATDHVRVDFIDEVGDVDLLLLDMTGGVIDTSTSVTDNEEISLGGLDAGMYFIRVFGFNDALNDYDLTIRVDEANGPTGDFLEPNDSIGQATNLDVVRGREIIEGLTIHRDANGNANSDFFRMFLPVEGSAGDDVAIRFPHADGDLDLFLLDSTGGIISASTSVTDNEEISLDGLSGELFIEVIGFAGDTNHYTLVIDAPEVNGPIPDTHEPNDTIATATDLRQVTGEHSITDRTIHRNNDGSANPDFFRFELVAEGTGNNFIGANFEHGRGDLDMVLFDANGNQIDGAFSVTDNERISLEGLAAGIYTVEVFGFRDAVNHYDLVINAPDNTALQPDSHEPNDTPAEATDLRQVTGAHTIEDRTIHLDQNGNANPDYYRFETLATGGPMDFVAIDFAHELGDLDIRLLDNNENGVDGSFSITDNERISLNDLPTGVYFLEVTGFANASNAYDLIIHAPEQGGLDQDRFEPNDSPNNPTDLREVAGELIIDGLTIHSNADGSGNEDFFQFTLTAEANASHFVQIDFENEQGDLDLFLVDANGNGQDVSAGITDTERVSLNGLGPGTFTVRVVGFNDSTAEYSLTINAPEQVDGIAPDNLEENDTQVTATQLQQVEGEVSVPGLTVHANPDGSANDDFFTFTTVADGRLGDFVEIRFEHANGDLDMELLDIDGNFIDGSSSVIDSETISLVDLPAGSYTVRVFGFNDATNRYDLGINAPEAGGIEQDRLEPNDSIQEATILRDDGGTISVPGLTVHANGDGTSNPDFFGVNLAAEGQSNHFVSISHVHSDGDLDLRLFDVNGNELGRSVSVTDNERISLEGLAAGSYFVGVTGKDGARAFYDLNLEVPRVGAIAPDAFEPNDSAGGATDLRQIVGELTITDLTIHGNGDGSPNDDFFTFETLGLGRGDDFVEIRFAHADADLDLVLFDSNNQEVDASVSITDNERVSFQGLAAGTYTVQVLSFDGGLTPYSLAINAPEPNAVIEPDELEPNDSLQDPTDLRQVTGVTTLTGLTIHADANGLTNDDFFRFAILDQGTSAHSVSIDFRNADGNLDLFLFDADGNLIEVSNGVDDGESVSLQGRGPGVFSVQVAGIDNATNRYDLTITAPEEPVGGLQPDFLEPNNSANEATDLTQEAGDVTITGLNIHNGSDEDFFRVHTNAVGEQGDGVTIQFSHAAGDLDAFLFDANGDLLRRAESITDNETLSLAGRAAGDYFIRVFGFDGATGEYTFVYNAPEVPTIDPDRMEPNDNFAGATDLRQLEGTSQVTGLTVHDNGNSTFNQDFFRFETLANGTANHFVGVDVPAAFAGNLQVQLFDASETLLRSSTDVNGQQRVSLDGLAAGTFFAVVSGTAPAPYSLNVSAPLPNGLPADDREPNDDFDNATNLSIIEGPETVNNLTVHLVNGASNDDFFRFETLAEGTPNSGVSINFANVEGNLGLELFDANRNLVGQSQTTNNTETVSLNGLAAGVYFARVSAEVAGASAAYALNVNAPVRQGGFQIEVRFTDNNLSADQQAVFTTAANRWSELIVGDLPDAQSNRFGLVDDVVIEAAAPTIDGPGGILGQAGPREFRNGSTLPISGIMRFDIADVIDLVNDGQFENVILHEMGHVLGIGTLWDFKGFLQGGGSADPRFTGTNAVREYNDNFGLSEASVPVANTGGPGTRDGHWREAIFQNELMTGFLNGGQFNPISRMTVGSLEDLGYIVNYDAADPYPPPGGAAAAAESPDPATDEHDHGHGHITVLILDPDSPGDLGDGLSFTPEFVSSLQAVTADQVIRPDDFEANRPPLVRENGTIDGLTLHNPAGFNGQGDQADAFRLRLVGTGRDGDFIRVNRENLDRSITLQLVDEDGNVVATSNSGASGSQEISLDGVSAGRYRITVNGEPNRYSLTVNAPLNDSIQSINITPLPQTGGTYEILIDGNDTVLRRQGGTEVLRRATAQLPDIEIIGSNQSDTLIVDLTNGNPIPVNGLLFIGLGQEVDGADRIRLRGGAAADVAQTFIGPGTGIIGVDDRLIGFIGVEPLEDELTAGRRLFNFDDSADTFTIEDDPMGMRIVSGALGQIATFANPNQALVLDTGDGNDSINLEGVASIINGALEIHGAGGDDRVTIDGNGLDFNLTRLADNIFSGIEDIDIAGDGDNTLEVNLAEVLSLADNDDLRIRANAGDLINIGPGWSQTGTEEVDGQTFRIISQGDATLRVSQDAFAPLTFRALAVQIRNGGVEVPLLRDLDLDALNLYDGGDPNVDGADVTLINDDTGEEIRGSLVYDADTRMLRFIRSGGPLEPGNYTLTLGSRADGVVDASGEVIDGDGDDNVGGNLTFQFNVPATSGRLLSIIDVIRGVGQDIELSEGGIPVSVSDATDVTSLGFTLTFDSSIINVTGAELASGVPNDWVINVDTSTAGQITVTASGPTALSGADLDVIIINASVPGSAANGAQSILEFTSASINGGAISADVDSGLFQATYIGDVDGIQGYSILDAISIARTAFQLDSGFDGSDTTDPNLLGAATGGNGLSILDAIAIARKAFNLPQPNVPDIPNFGGSPARPAIPTQTISALSVPQSVAPPPMVVNQRPTFAAPTNATPQIVQPQAKVEAPVTRTTAVGIDAGHGGLQSFSSSVSSLGLSEAPVRISSTARSSLVETAVGSFNLSADGSVMIEDADSEQLSLVSVLLNELSRLVEGIDVNVGGDFDQLLGTLPDGLRRLPTAIGNENVDDFFGDLGVVADKKNLLMFEE